MSYKDMHLFWRPFRPFAGCRLQSQIWVWGHNGSHQLGLSNTVSRDRPVKLSGLTDIVEIYCGSEHTVALNIAGQVRVKLQKRFSPLSGARCNQKICFSVFCFFSIFFSFISCLTLFWFYPVTLLKLFFIVKCLFLPLNSSCERFLRQNLITQEFWVSLENYWIYLTYNKTYTKQLSIAQSYI